MNIMFSGCKFSVKETVFVGTTAFYFKMVLENQFCISFFI
ncbi:hypothetical protein LEP1GSC074_0357 [Leptospira noguchii str. Hook]|uniref:Uncharacterized protein n=1 Tax=Leptospira noguchii serovar Autumnalis str. ZUN142 TaxID=1085540 RepID=M6UT14_9LEPT|nr:hypothetical protein LEP1GSC041_3293 [Leptospira noguchii str. 2006001870]EMO40408.1 hypothetical protein LEP1GSC186_4605 [Leptospira noguchii serovar Autumnalis str. ZUN142]EMS83773.1 hypothetical protein LEP1GSC074_0357 [Leptospira noguchii str. Hook]EMS86673.1 hypothetical protein LEP1GSC073_1212 [Leptospira noguchii str. Cascata]